MKMTTMAGKRLCLLFLLCAAALAPVSGRADDFVYKLGPQDRIRVKVFEWRAATGETHEWAPLSGEYNVSSAGLVAIPLIGEVKAVDLTPSDLAAEISERLQSRIGLAQRPDTSVELEEYRPFYVLGDVDKPGEYAFRPGLTVVQALSIAGGIRRTAETEFGGVERNGIVNAGELRALQSERVSLLAQFDRLQAELAEKPKVTFSKELTETKIDGVDIAALAREQTLLFESRRASLSSQTDALKEVRDLLMQEVDALEAKGKSLDRQADLTKDELAGVQQLVAKGLAIVPRKVALQQAAAQLDSAKIDLDLASLRAQQDISRTDRSAIDLKSQRRDGILQESSAIRAKLADNADKTETARRLFEQARAQMPELVEQIANSGTEPSFTIVRDTAQGSAIVAGAENDRLLPGDVLKVERRQGKQPLATLPLR